MSGSRPDSPIRGNSIGRTPLRRPLLADLFPPPNHASLSKRLRKLHRVFRLGDLRAEALDTRQVVAYYEQCFSAYQKHHSSEGAMHLAISDGDTFHPTGFYGQLRRIAATWPDRPPQGVLELGFGQGFNLAHLAERFPGVRFFGVDITPAHQEVARRRLQASRLSNVELIQGDFHQLPYADASFDHVFAIEAFCYATDMARAFAEIFRVLRPGGTVTFFDGYLIRQPQTFTADEALAAELVAKGVALESFQLVDDVVAKAHGAGLELKSVTSFDAEIMPNLRKLARLTGAIIRFPWLGRRALARRHPMRGRNVLTGYLLHSTVYLGITVYREIAFAKRG
jgi:SAM-dependent methyltransferase